MAEGTHEAQDDPGRWLLVGDLPCLQCQYNLRGLAGPIIVCPECGHHNDLSKPELWKVNDLPWDVECREQLPASAAFWSVLLSCAVLLFCVVPSPYTVPLALLLLLLFGVWIHRCILWLRGTKHLGWALGILFAAHIRGWLLWLALPLGLVSEEFGDARYLVLLVIPLSIWEKFQIHRSICRAERKGWFRDNSRHIPTEIVPSESHP